MYQYRIFDLFDEDDPETWARDLADRGWEFAVRRTGVLVKVNGVVRRRYYLRRPLERAREERRARSTTPADGQPRDSHEAGS